MPLTAQLITTWLAIGETSRWCLRLDGEGSRCSRVNKISKKPFRSWWRTIRCQWPPPLTLMAYRVKRVARLWKVVGWVKATWKPSRKRKSWIKGVAILKKLSLQPNIIMPCKSIPSNRHLEAQNLTKTSWCHKVSLVKTLLPILRISSDHLQWPLRRQASTTTFILDKSSTTSLESWRPGASFPTNSRELI